MRGRAVAAEETKPILFFVLIEWPNRTGGGFVHIQDFTSQPSWYSALLAKVNQGRLVVRGVGVTGDGPRFS